MALRDEPSDDPLEDEARARGREDSPDRRRAERRRRAEEDRQALGPDEVDVDKFFLDPLAKEVEGFDLRGSIVGEPTITRTIEGASTISLPVSDPEMYLLRSELLAADQNSERLRRIVDVNLDGLWFRLDGVNGTIGAQLELIFLSRPVAQMIRLTKPLKAVRTDDNFRGQTRAEFIRQLVLAIPGKPVPFVTPELHTVQPEKDSEGRVADGVARDPVAAPAIADAEAAAAIGTPKSGWSGCTLTYYRPSLGGINGREGGGAWAGHPIYDETWGCAAPPEYAFGTAIEFSYQGKSIIVPVMDRGGAITGSHFDLLPRPAKALGMYSSGMVSAKFRTRGRVRVRGSNLSSDTGRTGAGETVSISTEQPYEFTVGPPEGPRGENYWECGQRLASDVNWRLFEVGGRIHYVSEDDLFAAPPRATITPDSPGVEYIDIVDWLPGRRVKEVQLGVRIGRWAVPPGKPLRFEECGPIDDKWLVVSIERPIFSSLAVVTVRKPQMPKLEPPNEVVTNTIETGLGADGSGGVGPSADFGGNNFAWPTSVHAGDNFGENRGDHIHAGIDIPVSYQPVRAAAAGSCANLSDPGGYGTYIVIQHGNGWETRYGHLSASKVGDGEKVAQGQVIATSGNTGSSTGPHLHFEIRHNGKPVNPRKLLP